jgi:hypothetical protein
MSRNEEFPIAPPRTTIFPTTIVNRTQEFVGSHVQGRGRLVQHANRDRGRNRSTLLSASGPLLEAAPLPSSRPPPAVNTVTRSIYSFPQGAIWTSRGDVLLPFLENWPLDSPSVLVSLPSNTIWGGYTNPTIFQPQTAEYGVANVFNHLPRFRQETSNYSGLFYKRSNKRKGSGASRGYYLEPYHRSYRAFFGTLPPNAKIIYCLDANQLPNEGVENYYKVLQTSTLSSTSSTSGDSTSSTSRDSTSNTSGVSTSNT